MRILIVTTYGFDPAFPSRPEQLQARALVARGHTVIAHEYFDRRYPGQSRRHEWLPGPVPVHRSTTLGFFGPESLLRLIETDRPDIIHLHHLRNLLGFQTVLAASQLRIPTVLTIHGLLHDGDLVADRERPLESPLRYENILTTLGQLASRLARGAHPRRAVRNYLIHSPLLRIGCVIALSHAERDLLIRLGVNPSRIQVLPNAVDLRAYDHEPPPVALRPPLVLFIGQLVPRKGYDLLARAIPLVLRAVPTARFVFVSHNRAGEADLRHIVENSGVASHLEIVGPVSESEKIRLLHDAAVVAVPSRYEGFGIPVIEAMAAGAPVVTTDVIACNEIVKHEHTGLLVPYGHVEALAEAIIRLLNDRALGARLAAAGRTEVFNRYRAETLAAHLEALYCKLMTEHAY
ncbi:MAG: glycosyltransferase family 4 protein [Chloroflexus sp.]|uniref:glycosyltransferase family 4 protein n=1 Tax=Chloroflexus sp. TaxID=1904827 RepID=UPI0030A9270A